MDIDWSQLVWQGRWTALEIFWNAILLNIATQWWFAPLLVMLVLAAGWKAVLRLVAYVARVFAHTH
ncbi:hypothetical protein J2X63_003495 [Agromyces sp. 3263]|nr:hypothetical protein [Agromyces sp. 3263]